MFATKEREFQELDKSSINMTKPYSPSVEKELENTQQYLTGIEDAFEALLRKLEPVLPSPDAEDSSGIKGTESLRASELVEKVKRINSRLYEIQYALQQLPNYIQL